mmetsp:Transcript_76302/g.220432  ORF Transcript_76302/g.220432 Transcript_76302/m.220432 type:complete len:203 (-) Transcript_76302:987-1595(-)
MHDGGGKLVTSPRRRGTPAPGPAGRGLLQRSRWGATTHQLEPAPVPRLHRRRQGRIVRVACGDVPRPRRAVEAHPGRGDWCAGRPGVGERVLSRGGQGAAPRRAGALRGGEAGRRLRLQRRLRGGPPPTRVAHRSVVAAAIPACLAEPAGPRRARTPPPTILWRDGAASRIRKVRQALGGEAGRQGAVAIGAARPPHRRGGR